MRYYGGNNRQDSGDSGCLALLILGFIAMPLVGLYLMTKKDDESKALGLILLIVRDQSDICQSRKGFVM